MTAWRRPSWSLLRLEICAICFFQVRHDGKIADYVAGLRAAGVLSTVGFTFGASLVIGTFLALSLNAMVSALFTYRFLSACATLIEDQEASGVILLEAFINLLTDQLLSVAEIPSDLVKTVRVMIEF